MLSDEQLLKVVREQREYKRMSESVKAELEKLESQIKEEMEIRGVCELVLDIFKVCYKTITQSRMDAKAIQKDYPEITGKYMSQSEYKKLTIS